MVVCAPITSQSLPLSCMHASFPRFGTLLLLLPLHRIFPPPRHPLPMCLSSKCSIHPLPLFTPCQSSPLEAVNLPLWCCLPFGPFHFVSPSPAPFSPLPALASPSPPLPPASVPPLPQVAQLPTSHLLEPPLKMPNARWQVYLMRRTLHRMLNVTEETLTFSTHTDGNVCQPCQRAQADRLPPPVQVDTTHSRTFAPSICYVTSAPDSPLCPKRPHTF